MPKGSPFTALCQQVARGGRRVVADLHVHTTASDGDYTPSQVVILARQAGLSAVAVTDHDTLAGVPAADGVRVVPGVEMSGRFDGRETHILGLFVRTDCGELLDHLAGVCRRRRDRFRAYVAELVAGGVAFPNGMVEAAEAGSASLGRRHVAGLLFRAGSANNRHEAFGRFLGPLAGRVPPTHLTDANEVVRLIRAAGGVAALAHPARLIRRDELERFHAMGGRAVEVTFPAALVGHTSRLRGWCRELGLATAGGSDCHGPEGFRPIGSRGVGRAELDALEALAGSPG
jgi:hypothetical protein